MTRLGTCKHTFRIQESWSAPIDAIKPPEDLPPHIDPESDAAMEYSGWTKSDGTTDSYLCTWVHSQTLAPTPAKRQVYHLRDDDCDQCPLYVAAAKWKEKSK